MRQAGVREARQNLSVLLEHVRAGQEIVITDRGRPVARLLAPLPMSPRSFRGRAALRRELPTLEPPVSATIAEGGRRRLGATAAGGLTGPLYLDGTALAKLYLPEPGSASLERLVRGRRDLTVSDLGATELISALARRAPRGAAVSRLKSALIEDLESGVFRRAELSPRAHRAAERLAASLGRQAPARWTTLLHLALAMTMDATTLVTFDPQLAEAGLRVGLRAYP